MKRIEDQRVIFYLKHRLQIEEWLSVKKDLAAVAHEFYGSLREEVLNQVPSDVVVGDVIEPDNNGLFQLRKRDWIEGGPAVELGWNPRTRLEFSNRDWVWCGIWADSESPCFQYLRDARERPGTKGYPEFNARYGYPMYRHLPCPEGKFWEDHRLEAYGKSVVQAVLQGWDDLAPLVDEALSNS